MKLILKSTDSNHVLFVNPVRKIQFSLLKFVGSCPREPVRRRAATSLIAEVLRVARDHLCVCVAYGEAAAVAAAVLGGIQLAARREADAEGSAGGQLRHAVQQSEGERRRTQEGQGEKGGG